MTLVEQDPRKILELEGFGADRIAEVIDVLSSAPTLDRLREEFENRGITLNADQYLLPVFTPLYRELPQIREGILQQLTKPPITPALAEEYLIASGNLPFATFFFRHRELNLDPEFRKTFANSAREVVLHTLRGTFSFT